MKYLAIDIGGTYTKYAIITEQCQILEKAKRQTVAVSMQAFVDSLVDIYEAYRGQVNGIAISTAGIIDSDLGLMHTGGNLKCISELNIKSILQERLGVQVTVENDAKCAGLAEVWKGALENCKDGIVLVIGTGIGGAVIHDRKVLRGIHNMAGEFSYVITDSKPEFSLDQTFAGNTGVGSLIKIVSRHTRIPTNELDGEKIFAMADNGDELTIKGIREYARQLAIQINNYQFIFDPEKIVIGGGVSVQMLLIQLIREELQKIAEVYPWELPVARVEACRFYNDANLIGAVYMHMKCNMKNVI